MNKLFASGLLAIILACSYAKGFTIHDEKSFLVHLEPNQEFNVDIPDAAWVEPDAYCRVGKNVIRDEYSVGQSNFLAQGQTVIAAGFRFPVNVKVTFFKIDE